MLRVPWTARRSKQSILKEISPGISLEGMMLGWNSSTLATSCEELTHWKILWCWEELGAGEDGDDRGWDGWMASLTRCTWVWVNSGSLWWTGRPGVLQLMGSQTVGHDWETELNWTELILHPLQILLYGSIDTMGVKVLCEQEQAPLLWGKPAAIHPHTFTSTHFHRRDLALSIGTPSASPS